MQQSFEEAVSYQPSAKTPSVGAGTGACPVRIASKYPAHHTGQARGPAPTLAFKHRVALISTSSYQLPGKSTTLFGTNSVLTRLSYACKLVQFAGHPRLSHKHKNFKLADDPHFPFGRGDDYVFAICSIP